MVITAGVPDGAHSLLTGYIRYLPESITRASFAEKQITKSFHQKTHKIPVKFDTILSSERKVYLYPIRYTCLWCCNVSDIIHISKIK